MLAYYSSLVKKEDLMERVAMDAEQVAAIANDLVCELKVLASSSKNKNLENCIDAVKSAESLLKIVTAMTDNLKLNIEGYTSALLSQKTANITEDKPVQKEQSVETIPVQTPVVSEQEKMPDFNQLSSLMEAVKSLKEMKESLTK